jgi:alpha-D-xyloside xylohydrolase
VVRRWWRLRYCLIPYLLEQAERVVQTGQALLAPLAMYHESDPTCWFIDDVFYCGSDFLVAPIMDEAGTRRVYLPAGEWVDLWSGEKWSGAQWLVVERVALEHMPVFVRKGAQVPVYPHVVSCTDDMDPAKNVTLSFDDGYNGLAASVLGSVTGLS